MQSGAVRGRMVLETQEQPLLISTQHNVVITVVPLDFVAQKHLNATVKISDECNYQTVLLKK